MKEGDLIFCNNGSGPFTKGMYYIIQMVDEGAMEFAVIDNTDMLNWMEHYPPEECETSYLMWFEDIKITKRNLKLMELGI